jgi:hypothetical protein
VTIAGAACTNVVRLNATAIRCETGKAPGALGSRPLGPQAVVVTVQVGWGAHPSAAHLWKYSNHSRVAAINPVKTPLAEPRVIQKARLRLYPQTSLGQITA